MPARQQTGVAHTVDALCYVEHWVCKGQDMMTTVYRQARECYTAETILEPDDRIITDAPSEDEALRTHLRVLPLALLARGALY